MTEETKTPGPIFDGDGLEGAEEESPEEELNEEELEEAEGRTSAGRLSRMSMDAEAGFSWDQLERMKVRIEKGLKAPDFGEVLTGRAVQEVEIIPEHFSVAFRMATAGHRRAILKSMQKAFGSSPMTAESMFHQQILTLACGLAKIQAAELPDPLVKGKDTLDPDILKGNMDAVVGLPDQIFWMVWFNQTWHSVRMGNMLTMKALGNG